MNGCTPQCPAKAKPSFASFTKSGFDDVLSFMPLHYPAAANATHGSFHAARLQMFWNLHDGLLLKNIAVLYKLWNILRPIDCPASPQGFTGRSCTGLLCTVLDSRLWTVLDSSRQMHPVFLKSIVSVWQYTPRMCGAAGYYINEATVVVLGNSVVVFHYHMRVAPCSRQ